MTTLKDNIVTLQQIQEASGLSISHLRKLTRDGVLKGKREGRSYVYSAAQVNKALEPKLQKPLRVRVPDTSNPMSEVW